MIAGSSMSMDQGTGHRPVPGTKIECGEGSKDERRDGAKAALFNKPVDLDMGEASREQGFKLFGCR